MFRRHLCHVAIVTILFFAAASSLAETRSLSITARSETTALPQDAIIEVELLDVSRADAPSTALVSRRLGITSLPVSIELPYDSEAIDRRMSYVVAARLLSGDKVLLRTTKAYPVLTRGGSDSVEVVLERLAAAPSAPAPQQPIVGAQWTATEIAGRALIAKSPPTIAFLEDGSFTLFSGCNRFRGKAELADGRIAFPSPLAGTRRACPPERAKLEQDILESLQQTVGYRRAGTILSFVNEAGVTTVRFQEGPD